MYIAAATLRDFIFFCVTIRHQIIIFAFSPDFKYLKQYLSNINHIAHTTQTDNNMFEY